MLDDRREREAEQAVAKLLASLKRIEAPGDFNFAVRSRIARARNAGARPIFNGLRRLIPAAIPVALLLAAGAFYIVRESGTEVGSVAPPLAAGADFAAAPTQAAVPADAEQTISGGGSGASKADFGSIQPPTPADSTASAANAKAVAGSSIRAGRTVEPNRFPNDSAGREAASRGGSYVEAAKRGKIALPRGFTANPIIKQLPADVASDGAINVRDVLDRLGAEAGEDLTISSVRENSIAAKAGLKAGDRIEAINGKPVNAKTSYRGQFDGNSVTVRRDGKAAEVILKP
jgi:membrane-associated protease RseP (regulator of RpoE activity)